MQTTTDRLSRVASALVLYWLTLGPLWTAAGIGPGRYQSNKIARTFGYRDADEVRAAVRARLTPRAAALYGF